MKQIHAARHAPEAHLVKGFLESNGISAVVRGEFLTSGEMILSQEIPTNGVYTFRFAVPTNSISTTTSTVYYARFRLFDSVPGVPSIAFLGLVLIESLVIYTLVIAFLINGK